MQAHLDLLCSAPAYSAGNCLRHSLIIRLIPPTNLQDEPSSGELSSHQCYMEDPCMRLEHKVTMALGFVVRDIQAGQP